jgi:hypothetical protein
MHHHQDDVLYQVHLFLSYLSPNIQSDVRVSRIFLLWDDRRKKKMMSLVPCRFRFSDRDITVRENVLLRSNDSIFGPKPLLQGCT